MREGVGIATNNVAEYRAAILGMKYALRKGFKHVRVQGDSNLVCMQVESFTVFYYILVFSLFSWFSLFCSHHSFIIPSCNRFRVGGKLKVRIWLSWIKWQRISRISSHHSRSIMLTGYRLIINSLLFMSFFTFHSSFSF